MAVSVLSAAGVVTTRKVGATDGVEPVAVVVDYTPGAKYSYMPKQFNNDWTDFWASTSPGKHFEAATGGAAYSSLRTSQAQSGKSSATVGMYWQLKLPSGWTWNDVKDKPCKVTTKVNYYIAAKGNADTKAIAFWGPVIAPWSEHSSNDFVLGNEPVHTKSVVTSTTWQGKVGDVFLSNGGIYGSAGALVLSWQFSAGSGQASAAAVCSSIVLEFPAS
jgi:hypothetical protein